MNIGWVGLGKLGLPCAAVLASKGHDVIGYDVDLTLARRFFEDGYWPHHEEGLDVLRDAPLKITDDLADVVRACDVIFVAVQTPHHPDYEGVTPTPDEPRDFDYSYLSAAVESIVATAEAEGVATTIVIVSTVLPGTCARILPESDWARYAYSPSFIAMGTVVPDFQDPEFTLIGVNDDEDAPYGELAHIAESLHNAPIIRTSIASAELAKVAYNTFIGLKIVFANTLSEICEATGADVDEVTSTLAMAKRRLISDAYMRAGMGDGGGCHPRDQIAMSWLAHEHALSVDLFDFVARARDAQTLRLAALAESTAEAYNLPIVVLGQAYKANSTITTGSPARLLVHYLKRSWEGDLGIKEAPPALPIHPAVYVVATRHDHFQLLQFPRGSVVIDPWRYISDQDGVTVMRLGGGT